MKKPISGAKLGNQKLFRYIFYTIVLILKFSHGNICFYQHKYLSIALAVLCPETFRISASDIPLNAQFVMNVLLAV